MVPDNWCRVVLAWINSLKLSLRDVKDYSDIISENILGKLLGIIETCNESGDERTLEEVSEYLKTTFPLIYLDSFLTWGKEESFFAATLLLSQCSVLVPSLVQPKASKLPECLQTCIVHLLEAFVHTKPPELTRCYMDSTIQEMTFPEDLLNFSRGKENGSKNITYSDSPLSNWFLPAEEKFTSSPATPKLSESIRSASNTSVGSARKGRKRLNKVLIEIECLKEVKAELEEEIAQHNASIHDLRQEISSKNKVILALKTAADAAESSKTTSGGKTCNCDVDSIKYKLECTLLEKEALEGDILWLRSENEALTSKKDKFNDKVEFLEKVNKELNEKLEETEETRDNLQKKSTNLKQQLEEFKHRCEALEERLTEFRGPSLESLDDMPNTVFSLASEFHEIEINDLRNELKEKASQLAEVQSQKEELSSTISTLLRDIQTLENTIQTNTKEFDTKFAQLESIYSKVNFELQEAKHNNHMLQEASQLKDQALISVHKDFETMSKEYDTKNSQLEIEFNQIKAKLNQQNSNYECSLQLIDSLTAQVNDLSKEKELLQSKIKKLTTELINSEKTICSNKDTLAQNETLIAKYDEALGEVDNLKHTISEMTSNHSIMLIDLQKSMAESAEKISFYTSKCQELEELCIEKGIEIQALKDTVAHLYESIKEVKTLEEAKEASCEKLKESIVLLSTECDRASNSLQDKTRELNDLSHRYTILHGMYESNYTELQHLKSLESSCRIEVEGLRRSLFLSQDNIKELNIKCEGLETTCNEKTLEVKNLKGCITNMELQRKQSVEKSTTEKKELNNALKKLNEEKETLSKDVKSKGEKIKALQKELTSLNSRCESSRAEIVKLNNTFTAKESNLQLEINKHQKVLAEKDRNYQRINLRYEKLRSLNLEKESSIKKLKEDIEKLTKSEKACKSERDTLNIKMQSLLEEKETLRQSHETQSKELVTVMDEISKLKILYHDTDSKLKAAETKNVQLLDEILVLKVQLDEAFSEISSLKSSADSVECDLKIEVDSLQNQLAKENDRSNDLIRSCLSKDTEITNLKETIVKLNSEINDLKISAEKSMADIKSINNAIMFLFSEYGTHLDLNSVESVESIKSFISEMMAKTKNLDEQAQKLCDENKSLISLNATLRAEVEELHTSQCLLKEENTNKEKLLAELRDKLLSFNSGAFQSTLEDKIKVAYHEKLLILKKNMKQAYTEKLEEINSENEMKLLEEKEKNTRLTAEFTAKTNELYSTIRDLQGKVSLLEKKKTDSPAKKVASSLLRSKVKSEDNLSGYSNPGFDETFRDNATHHVDTCRRSSIRSLPPGLGKVFPAADEDEVFDARCLSDLKSGAYNFQYSSLDRLSTLQKRNSMCPPHLRSCYPGETQFAPPETFKEDDLKHGQAAQGAASVGKLKGKGKNTTDMPAPTAPPPSSKSSPGRFRSFFSSSKKDK